MGDEAIVALRMDRGGLYDASTGLKAYGLQDTNGCTGHTGSVLLTGKLFNPNETKILRGAGLSRSDKCREVGEVWNSVNVAGAVHRRAVVSIRLGRRDSGGRLHALVMKGFDDKTRKATLVNPWGEREIRELNARDQSRNLSRVFDTADFGCSGNMFFIPL
jgi:hypothetical protein